MMPMVVIKLEEGYDVVDLDVLLVIVKMTRFVIVTPFGLVNVTTKTVIYA